MRTDRAGLLSPKAIEWADALLKPRLATEPQVTDWERYWAIPLTAVLGRRGHNITARSRGLLNLSSSCVDEWLGERLTEMFPDYTWNKQATAGDIRRQLELGHVVLTITGRGRDRGILLIDGFSCDSQSRYLLPTAQPGEWAIDRSMAPFHVLDTRGNLEKGFVEYGSPGEAFYGYRPCQVVMACASGREELVKITGRPTPPPVIKRGPLPSASIHSIPVE
jgi:hypothetical protein